MSQKGKFINAFQSIQMLGDYEGENAVEKTADSESLLTGEELYNPLEGLDDIMVDNFDMDLSQSPENQPSLNLLINESVIKDMDIPHGFTEVQHFSNSALEHCISSPENNNHELQQVSHREVELPSDSFNKNEQSLLNSSSHKNNALSNTLQTPDNVNKSLIFQDIGDHESSSSSSSEITPEKKYEKTKEKQANNSPLQNTSLSVKENEQKATSFVDDNDELLGTALAELEEEERAEQKAKEEALSRQKELTKKQKEEKKKKKKKKKLKDGESDKKKKKKKQKKKNKESKDEPSEKKKKKEKSYKTSTSKSKSSSSSSKGKERARSRSPDRKVEVKTERVKKEKKQNSSSNHRARSPEKRKERKTSQDRHSRKRSPRSHESPDHHSKKSKHSHSNSRRHSPVSEKTRKNVSPPPERTSKKRKTSESNNKRCDKSLERNTSRRIETKDSSKSKKNELKRSISREEKKSHSNKISLQPEKLSKDEFYRLQEKVLKDSNANKHQPSLSSSLTDSESEAEVPIGSHRYEYSYQNEIPKTKHIIAEHKPLNQHTVSKNNHVQSEHIEYREHSRKIVHNKSVDNNFINDHHNLNASPMSEASSSNDSEFRSMKQNKLSIDLSRPEENEIGQVKPLEFDQKEPQPGYVSPMTSSLWNVSPQKSNEQEIMHKSSKPGSLSLREYKKRKSEPQSDGMLVKKKTVASSSPSYTKPLDEGRKRSSHSTSSSHDIVNDAPYAMSLRGNILENKSESSTIEKSPNQSELSPSSGSFDRENKENRPYSQSAKSRIQKDSHNDDVINEDHAEANVSSKSRKEKSIPLLFDTPQDESNELNQTNDDDDDSTVNTPENLSPYNPEAASPLNLESPENRSPSVAALEDRTGVDFNAYKDVHAFEDIMKSKVKHEARKHKRKKLEEMKQQIDNDEHVDKSDRKMVDYLIRQSQVEEHMKNVLKQYFKSKEITKDEYKNILKKAVPRVTMSDSPIIPEKIQSLMVKFVRKCKGQRISDDHKRRKQRRTNMELAKQQEELQRQLESNAAMLDSLQPFQPIRVLNPNLPMPPM